MRKWPEKAVSESSGELAQLSFLVQSERAECVTFPLSAAKVTHWTSAVLKNRYLVQFYGHAAAKPSAMQAAARQVKGAEGYQPGAVGRENSGVVQTGPAFWRSKRTYRVKTRASVAIICDPVFAEVCTGKRQPSSKGASLRL